MSKIVDMSQNGPTWKKWRDAGLGSSDACSIMGKVKWKSRDDLLSQKRHEGYVDKENAAMGRGTRLEPEARRLYEDLTGRKMRPVCMEHDKYSWLRASLDGWNPEDRIILEIKCMGDWNHKKCINSGLVPYYYLPQIHHQMLVCDTAKCVHLWAYTDSVEFAPENRFKLIVVDRNEEYLKALFEKEAAFIQEVRKKV